MQSPKTCCPRCEGTGKIDLDPALAEVFSLVSKVAKSTSQIYRELKNRFIGQTAISNRLAKLQSLGLIELYEIRGRTKFWRRK